jgi:methylenetetrahydrofolate dehydrogenase (NADP+)/methenyltetrahydrofolate cyclohydrolase/formyltetrahydrofolate synthetase/formate--tetrahydrofolate ligase
MKSRSIPGDIDIAQAAKARPVLEIAHKAGLLEEEVIPYGRDKAKVRLESLERLKTEPKGKYIIVTAITPTPLGEGKTTTAIGLTEAFGSVLKKKAICCIRQPSMGPTFNIKGGAAGGGYSQIIPMEDFNLHLTGDTHAVSIAHNLVAAAIDSRIYHESRQSDNELESHGIKRLDIDPGTITWRRVVDMCDRSLREIETGLHDSTLKDGSPSPVFPRKTGFDITEASELMALLALAEGEEDLRERIGRVIVALDKNGRPVTLERLEVAGAVTALLKDALLPNLMQTLEGQPAFVHCGPFANIAHGNSSVIADRIALKLADYVVTEGGFGADIGAEKFFDIKCRSSALTPDAAVLVASVRALKLHGGRSSAGPEEERPAACCEDDLPLLKAGLCNLGRHIRNVKRFGIPVVVAINRFLTDSPAELNMVRRYALDNGADEALFCTSWTDGGKGAADLARSVEKLSARPSRFNFLYELDIPIADKIKTIATEIYGAGEVNYEADAEGHIAKIEELGFGKLPVCIAKTPYSFSQDPSLKGAPEGFKISICEVRLNAGAGFISALAGDIMTMPGMATRPAYMNIDIDRKNSKIKGLS